MAIVPPKPKFTQRKTKEIQSNVSPYRIMKTPPIFPPMNPSNTVVENAMYVPRNFMHLRAR